MKIILKSFLGNLSRAIRCPQQLVKDFQEQQSAFKSKEEIPRAIQIIHWIQDSQRTVQYNQRDS